MFLLQHNSKVPLHIKDFLIFCCHLLIIESLQIITAPVIEMESVTNKK